jgi:exosortase F-associated protein
MVLVTGLIAVRFYENELFYNPLLTFFKTDHSTQPLPEFDATKLYLSVTLRYIINTVLSLAILWMVFRSKEVLKFSVILYITLFIVLFFVFIILMNTSEAGNHMALFYVRRFLIQPLFLLILLPAFYFQKRNR